MNSKLGAQSVASYVLDTSAVLAVLMREEGADQVRELLANAQDTSVAERPILLAPFLALMEAEYRLRRLFTEREAERVTALIESWPVEVRESTLDWRRWAARLKASGRLSLADAWIASLAMMEDAELVHKDPEYDGVPGLKALRLPYRRQGRRRR